VDQVVSSVTYPRPERACLVAKRLECAELAPAMEGSGAPEGGSKLRALQTLRDTRVPFLPYDSVFMPDHTKDALTQREP
jgi:hypothetical protein